MYVYYIIYIVYMYVYYIYYIVYILYIIYYYILYYIYIAYTHIYLLHVGVARHRYVPLLCEKVCHIINSCLRKNSCFLFPENLQRKNFVLVITFSLNFTLRNLCL